MGTNFVIGAPSVGSAYMLYTTYMQSQLINTRKNILNDTCGRRKGMIMYTLSSLSCDGNTLL